eukprot:TRINITY_DN19451_c0_g1_i1.p1 TRINITY_DN19451_c0_g1~~TRINITY_DN19451_c0_g1_i1.p1  ORF type:complete len:274 (+),score=52.63 TRINITY_DN19451_c0_g1_i1:107-928(+)
MGKTEPPPVPAGFPDQDLLLLPEVSRDAFAEFYADLQSGNPTFRILSVSHADLTAYGGIIYDVCIRPPCLSVCYVERGSGRVTGCYVQCPAEDFDAIDNAKITGNCAAHAAYAKHCQNMMRKRWRNLPGERLIYGVFGGVRPEFAGSGMFAALTQRRQELQLQQNCPWSWGFTVNPAMLLKGLKQSPGMPGTKATIPGVEFADRVLSSMLHLPDAMLNGFKEMLVFFGYLQPIPILITDLHHFTYNGCKPFKESRKCVIAMHKVPPSVDAAKL